MDLNQKEGDPGWIGFLMKDGREISCVECLHMPPIPLPSALHITEPFSRASQLEITTHMLPSFELHERGFSISNQPREWQIFLNYLHTYRKVAHVLLSGWELLIQPPKLPTTGTESLRIRYRPSIVPAFVFKPPRETPSIVIPSHPSYPMFASPNLPDHSTATSPPPGTYPLWTSPTAPARPGAQVNLEVANVGESLAPKEPHCKVARVHPKFLHSLELTHTDWAFGGVAELIDNARDAGATRLDLSVAELRWKAQGRSIPVLQVTDNGYGMTHENIVRMLSFGHDSPSEDNITQIGRFGVGFKTGTMRVGDDVLVLTQSQKTRSIGLLSKSYNKGKDELEVPIVTYCNYDGIMELDTKLLSEADEEAAFKGVETFSPFDKFRIGSEFDKIGTGKTGTRIFVYNLKTWGGSKCLFEWESEGRQSADRDSKGDIMIQGKRIRTRNGQTSLKVPLDYSLRAYVRVMFLVPNMSIYIQGSRVRTVKLADDLHSTKKYRGVVLGKPVILTLGFRQTEFERGNCGIFLYWHKRLIKAYTRVGRMVHSADYGRGVIGVIDITELMDFGNGDVGVLASKQGFKDCEQYVKLEEWLADKVHEYCDDKDNMEVLNPLELGSGVKLEPDQEWVQCDKCQQWRSLPVGVSSNDLPTEWFCYMEPFRGKCEMPEENVGSGIVTVGVKRGNNLAGPQLGTGSDQSGVAHTDNMSEESSGLTKGKVKPQTPSQMPRIRIKEPTRGFHTNLTKEAPKKDLDLASKEPQDMESHTMKEVRNKETPASKVAAVPNPGGRTISATKVEETSQTKLGRKSSAEVFLTETPEAPKFKRLKKGG